MKPILIFFVLLLFGLLALVAGYAVLSRGQSPKKNPMDQPDTGTPFDWPANVTLEAPEEIIVVLPGDIVKDNETFDSVIITSDDTRIAFDPSDGSGAFRSISIWLMPGKRLKLTKPAKVRFQAPPGNSSTGEILMKVIKED